MFRSLIFISLLGALGSYLMTNDDITLNEKKIAANKQAEIKTHKKLEQLGKTINEKHQEILKLDDKISVLQKSISQNKDSFNKKEKQINEVKKNRKELEDKKVELQQQFITLLTQVYAIYTLNLDASSEQDVIGNIVYQSLTKTFENQIKKIQQEARTISRGIDSMNDSVNKLQSSIDAQIKQKEELQNSKLRQEQLLSSMKVELKKYNKELEDIVKERKKLNEILANLKIIQKSTLSKERALAPIPQASTDKHITPDKNIKIVSSAYKNISTASYNGEKTIPPLTPKTFKIEQKFGPTFDPVYKIRFFYENIILIPDTKNADVKSVLDGKIVFAKENPVIKRVVIIEHENSIFTIYAYLDKITNNIKPGVNVKKGMVIGKSSDRLSFEVTQKDKYIDPLQLIKID